MRCVAHPLPGLLASGLSGVARDKTDHQHHLGRLAETVLFEVAHLVHLGAAFVEVFGVQRYLVAISLPSSVPNWSPAKYL